MFALHVNLDHVATLRQARRGVEPEPVTAAGIAEMSGADGITIHLREDRRHIQDRDVKLIREVVQTRLNLEMAATSEMFRIAEEIQPDIVTLVPEKKGRSHNGRRTRCDLKSIGFTPNGKTSSFRNTSQSFH